MINLESLYLEVQKKLELIDFNHLWPGFKPLKFALYTQDKCFFNGKYIEKTDNFLANTSILYENEYIAIWNVQEEMPIELLVSKMVHEMFHGFQMENHESRFPNEREALEQYQYLDDNMSIKYQESLDLIDMIKSFSLEKYQSFLESRKYRLNHFPYEYNYEAKIEQIEGTANYVELCVLKQLSDKYFNMKLSEMIDNLLEKNEYLPIRVISYDIGALLIWLLNKEQLSFSMDFSSVPFSLSLLDQIQTEKRIGNLVFSEIIEKYYQNAQKTIDKAIKQNHLVEEGNYPLLGVNIYNAVYLNGYIISTFFVMYKKEDKDAILYGDFVIEVNEGNVQKIYQLMEE